MPWGVFGFRRKKEMPDGLWMKCEGCQEMVYRKTVSELLNTCPKCNYHFTISAQERIRILIDEGTFEEYYADLAPADPLNFRDRKTYKERLAAEQEKTGLKDAAVVGRGKIGGHDVIFGVTDSRFIMGSMGSVVGEKIARAAEMALEHRIPLILVSGSGGGARMHEGAISLAQMSKTAAAIARLDDAVVLFISVLTNPTMGGVAASFASLGDIIIAEPKALIGFAGPRTIWHTLKIELPKGFQRSEFLLEHGFIDRIVSRPKLKGELIRTIEFFTS